LDIHYRNSFRLAGLIGVSLGLLLFAVWALPALHFRLPTGITIALHSLLEVSSIIISVMVFSVGFMAQRQAPFGGPLSLASCAFLGVAILDFLHMLTYQGMPVIVPPYSLDQAITFFFGARLLAALAILAIPLTSVKMEFTGDARLLVVVASVVIAAGVGAVGLLSPESLPVFLVQGVGLTPSKIAVEYVIVGLNVAAAIAYYLRMRTAQPYPVVMLWAAAMVMSISEFSFTLYATTTDQFIHLAHLYKVIAYAFIFRAVYVKAVQLPFVRLNESESALRKQQDRLKEAAEQNALLAAVVANSRDAIVTRGLNHAILSWNAAAEEMFGYAASEMIGKDSVKLTPPELRQETVLNRDLTLQGMAVVDMESVRQTKEGRRIDVSLRISPIRTNEGALQGYSLIFRDISARKAAEVVLRDSHNFNISVLNSLSEQVAVVDPEGVILAVNESWRVFGRSNGAADAIVNPVGVNYLEVCEGAVGRPAGEEASAARDGIKAVLSGEKSTFLLEYPCHSPTEKRWFQLRVTPFRNSSRTGAVIVHENITARMNAEINRISLEAQLVESQKMEAIGTLAGGIAHDFNNALAAILGNVELAQLDAGGNEKVLVSLGDIKTASTRARELVQQILAFSRRQAVTMEPTSLAAIVEECGRLLQSTLPARIALVIQCESGLPKVMANAGQIHQVLINLGTNAMQGIGRLPGRISMRLERAIPDEDALRETPGLQAFIDKHPEGLLGIVVTDSGAGMDGETRKRIFEPFFTTKRVGEGTGLGLSVVHGIVQSHHGQITVRSEPGIGTVFTVYLPATEAEQMQPTSADAVKAAGQSKEAASEVAKHILYIDDQGILVSLVRRLLEKRGWRVSAYVNQEEALAALRAEPDAFDLVVSDYNMPGLSGLDVAREVRNIRSELPVVIASGFVDEELQANAKEAGVREVILKAAAMENFTDVIAGLLAKEANSTKGR